MIRLLKSIIEYPLGPDWRTRRAAQNLSLIGHEKRRAHIRSTARQIRLELGLSEDNRLRG